LHAGGLKVGGIEVIDSARQLKDITKFLFRPEILPADQDMLGFESTVALPHTILDRGQKGIRFFDVTGGHTEFEWDHDGVLREGTVPASRLKTSTDGYASGTTEANVILNAYTFFPSLVANRTGAVQNLRCYHLTSDPGDTIGRIGISETAGNPWWFRWRYCTSSGNPEMWFGLDEDDNVVVVWSSGDKPPESPPIDSETIVKLIKLNPSLSDFEKVRSPALEECKIEGNKLEIRGISFDIEIKDKKDVPRIRRIRKTITKTIKQRVPVIVPAKIFNELTGQWEERHVQKIELVPRTRYRLKNPELGEASEIEPYQIIEQQLVFEEREIIVEEEIEVEEPF